MDATRPLPHNLESEKSVLAMALLSRDADGELTARGFIPDWLHIPAHRVMWHAIAEFRDRVPESREVDTVAFLTFLLETPARLTEIGGPAAITDIAQHGAYVSANLFDFHVDILRQNWQRRQALALAAQLGAAAAQGDGFEERVADAINTLGAIATGTAGARVINGKDALHELLEDLSARMDGKPTSETPAMKTGIEELDEKTSGLIPGLWLIGADTSGGKTALTLQLARAVLAQGGRVLFFALEMTARQLVRRIVAGEGRVPMQRLLRPETLIEYDWGRLGASGANWRAENLLICDDGDMTIQEARSIARAEHAREPLALVVLDYIQLASAGRFRDGGNREQEVSFIGSQCVKMAKELGIPVIAPTQLNDDGKVRESRALKQHCAMYLVIEEQRILCAKGRDTGRDWSLPYKLTGDIQTFERI